MYLIWNNLATCAMMESNTPEGWIIIDVRDLSDVEKDVEKVKKKLITICGLMALEEKVCIRCWGGINRSNAIAIGAMISFHWREDIDEMWDDFYKVVKEKVNRVLITPELQCTIKLAIKELTHKA